MSADAAAVATRIATVAREAARIEARWLIEAANGDIAKLEALINRRVAGEPVDRVIGSRGFWTLDLRVTSDVLSPRSDTETIVRAVLELTRSRSTKNAPLRILDLGTGSGAILLALLAELPHASGLGIDISVAALAVARENAERNGLASRAAFQASDWAADISGTYDIVVSNPPYIPSTDIAALDREVRDFDPHLALDGGQDGLDPYRIIVRQLPTVLASNGFAVLEFGQGQGESIARIADAHGLVVEGFRNDLNGVTRSISLSKI